MLKKMFLFSLFLLIAFAGFTQETKEDIQKKQQQLQKELADLNNTLDAIKKNKKQSLGQLALVQKKIKARQELVTNINKQLHNIDDDIYNNTLEINHYKKELDTLKESYAKSLVFAYKNRSNYDYLNFIFSANTFNDAIKRIAYLKSYRQFRETQVDNITKTQDLLQQKISTLNSNKNVKNNTLQEQGKQLQGLESDQQEQDQVIKQLKGQEKDVAVEIKDKEKMRQKLQQSLQAIIRREIAAAKEREKQQQLARQQEEERKKKLQQTQAPQANTDVAKNNATNNTSKNNDPITGVVTPTKGNRSYSPFESTEEGLTQSLNFEGNRGRLPWPVSSGNVTSPFGRHSVPGTKLQEDNQGIDISLPAGSSVKSVADGEVSAVFDLGGGEQAVAIRHGKYFTSYSHLSTVSVNRGDKVSAGTLIGRAAAGDDGEGLLGFEIMNEKLAFLDPESWLRPR